MAGVGLESLLPQAPFQVLPPLQAAGPNAVPGSARWEAGLGVGVTPGPAGSGSGPVGLENNPSGHPSSPDFSSQKAVHLLHKLAVGRGEWINSSEAPLGTPCLSCPHPTGQGPLAELSPRWATVLSGASGFAGKQKRCAVWEVVTLPDLPAAPFRVQHGNDVPIT